MTISDAVIMDPDFLPVSLVPAICKSSSSSHSSCRNRASRLLACLMMTASLLSVSGDARSTSSIWPPTAPSSAAGVTSNSLPCVFCSAVLSALMVCMQVSIAVNFACRSVIAASSFVCVSSAGSCCGTGSGSWSSLLQCFPVGAECTSPHVLHL